jgi:hypothetical protein
MTVIALPTTNSQWFFGFFDNKNETGFLYPSAKNKGNNAPFHPPSLLIMFITETMLMPWKKSRVCQVKPDMGSIDSWTFCDPL